MRQVKIVVLILWLLGSITGCKALDNEMNYLNNTGATPNNFANGELWAPKSK